MIRASRAPFASILALCLAAFMGGASAYAQAAGGARPAAPIELSALAERWKAIWSFDPLSGQGYLMRGPDLIRFAPGRELYLVGPDGVLRSLAPTWEGGRIMLPAPSAEALEAWLASRDEEGAS